MNSRNMEKKNPTSKYWRSWHLLPKLDVAIAMNNLVLEEGLKTIPSSGSNWRGRRWSCWCKRGDNDKLWKSHLHIIYLSLEHNNRGCHEKNSNLNNIYLFFRRFTKNNVVLVNHNLFLVRFTVLAPPILHRLAIL